MASVVRQAAAESPQPDKNKDKQYGGDYHTIRKEYAILRKTYLGSGVLMHGSRNLASTPHLWSYLEIANSWLGDIGMAETSCSGSGKPTTYARNGIHLHVQSNRWGTSSIE